jgi:hypothetical protein
MKRFKNPNSLPVAPAYWRDTVNGHKEEFRSGTQPFSAFLSRVWAYCDANKRERPSQEAIENELCAQWPQMWCVGEGYHRPATNTTTQRAGGCRSCGRRG